MLEQDILSDHAAQQADTDAVRELGWSELSARLAAARDVRLALRRHMGSGRASFLSAAAQLRGPQTGGASYDERPVNPDALEHGKPNDGRNMDVAPTAVTADRETL